MGFLFRVENTCRMITLKIVNLLYWLVPIGIIIIGAFIRIERRLSQLEVNVIWLKEFFLSADFCNTDKKDGE